MRHGRKKITALGLLEDTVFLLHGGARASPLKSKPDLDTLASPTASLFNSEHSSSLLKMDKIKISDLIKKKHFKTVEVRQ